MRQNEHHRKRGENPKARNTALITVQANPTEIRGRSPAARSHPDEELRSSWYCAPDFEPLRLRDEEAGEMSEDEAVVVDVIERLGVEELHQTAEYNRVAVGTHDELSTKGNTLGTVAELWRTSVPSLSTLASTCMPCTVPAR